jgi:EVE domain-containing protein
VSKYWIVVAAAEHVRRGRAGGFTQACHGKAAPLRRMKPGDGIVCYSPTTSFRGADRLQAFTAIGVVSDGEPYLAEMGDRRPYRRTVVWANAEATPIATLLEALELTAGRANWGYRFRFGALEISVRDFRAIAAAMSASELRAA